MSSPKPTSRAGDLQSPPTGNSSSSALNATSATDGDFKSPARGLPTLASQASPSVFFNKDAPVRRYRNWLPHWRQPGKWYFVTFRLADSLAQPKLQQWKAERELWLELHPEPWSEKVEQEYHRRFTAKFETWLDAGEGECVLRRLEAHAAVASALKFFAAEATGGDCKSPARDIRYELGDFVVMPNHVHILVRPLGAWELEQVLQSWKTFTAKAINRTLGRAGTVWWKDNFDHLVRSAEKFAKFQRYIADNPAMAKLKPGEFYHHRSSLCYLNTPP